MMNNAFIQNSLSSRELSQGIRYLLFQTIFLPSLLSLGNGFLPIRLSASWLNVLFFCINFAAALWIFRRFLKGFFPLVPKQLLRILVVGILFLAIHQGCSWILGKLFSMIFVDFSNINDQSVSALLRENFSVMALCTVIFVPIAEECFFRGALFRGIYDHSPCAAWLVSVISFSFLHVMNYIGVIPPLPLFLSFLQYIPAGVCLAASYRLSGSLLCPILIHAAVNAVGMLTMR